MPLSVNSFLNFKFVRAAVLKPYKACLFVTWMNHPRNYKSIEGMNGISIH